MYTPIQLYFYCRFGVFSEKSCLPAAIILTSLSLSHTHTHAQHHCRRCGEVVCADCMDKVPLVRLRYVDPVVVCKVCIALCKTEDEFFQNHLKTLTTGGSMVVQQ